MHSSPLQRERDADGVSRERTLNKGHRTNGRRTFPEIGEARPLFIDEFGAIETKAVFPESCRDSVTTDKEATDRKEGSSFVVKRCGLRP